MCIKSIVFLLSVFPVTMAGGFHQPTDLAPNNHACSLQIRDSNNADVLLESELKLSDIVVNLWY